MINKLADIAQRMVAAGKGILAADESTGSIAKRLESINTPSTPDTRRDYREMLFGATEAMKANISGVILYDETIRQKAKDGTPLTEIMKKAGSIPGIKVDMGAKPLAGSTAKIETVTEGLDGLRERREVGVAHVGNDQPDQIGAAHDQRPRGRVRPVAQLVDGVQDPRPGGLRHRTRTVVDHVAHHRGAHPGEARDVVAGGATRDASRFAGHRTPSDRCGESLSLIPI